jgi:crossover junction endodeoxyribonuclease RuvC
MDKIIMGMDPGTNLMGYGIIKAIGREMKILQYGVIQLNMYKTHELKLKTIFERTLRLIEEYHPDEVAIEAPFYGKNIQSMLKLGRAQGVAMAAVLYRNIPITEYAPKKIKISVTGNGNASKEQVARMLEQLLEFRSASKLFDATDALAVALCHFYQKKSGIRKSRGWEAFLKENPDRKII